MVLGLLARLCPALERHNMELESRKHMVRQLAQRLNVLARNPEVERCLLSSSREINHLTGKVVSLRRWANAAPEPPRIVLFLAGLQFAAVVPGHGFARSFPLQHAV